MPGLILLEGPDDDDEFGYAARFRDYSLQQLIDAYNNEIGNPGWVRARGLFLVAPRLEFLSRNVDCSVFISDHGMRLNHRVELQGDRIIPVSDDP